MNGQVRRPASAAPSVDLPAPRRPTRASRRPRLPAAVEPLVLSSRCRIASTCGSGARAQAFYRPAQRRVLGLERQEVGERQAERRGRRRRARARSGCRCRFRSVRDSARTCRSARPRPCASRRAWRGRCAPARRPRRRVWRASVPRARGPRLAARRLPASADRAAPSPFLTRLRSSRIRTRRACCRCRAWVARSNRRSGRARPAAASEWR